MTGRGSAAMGAACGVCCGLPMLILTGVVATGVAVVASIAAGGVLAVAATTYLVVRRRAPGLPPAAAWMILGAGLLVSVVGLGRARTEADQASAALVATGLALLACLALLRLAAAHRRPDQLVAN